ncbi:MAG: DUF2071 domain-containing protein [Gemmatimonadota bacterium]|nr:DUF2071 domain-containing protein [Gemmatimonadota bacterium]
MPPEDAPQPTSDADGGVFLTGEWRHLVMLNYRVDPALLQPYVPAGTTLDSWEGATFLSVVGFLFHRTRVVGLHIPWHRNFEEVNLRFYVRREVDGEVRRAVTFISELVPRRAVAALAWFSYNEPYRALPMRHRIDLRPLAADPAGAPSRVEYAWRQPSGWSSLMVETSGSLQPVVAGSEAEFITEHYWGYTRQRDGGTVEYRVTHPRWRTWTVDRAVLTGNLAELHGAKFGAVLSAAPGSAFLADGSPIAVHMPRRLRL